MTGDRCLVVVIADLLLEPDDACGRLSKPCSARINGVSVAPVPDHEFDMDGVCVVRRQVCRAGTTSRFIRSCQSCVSAP
jgi:hypothetical protein